MAYFPSVKIQKADGNIINPATSENQVSGNVSIASIESNLGAKNDTPATSDSGNFSLISLFKRLLERFTTLLTNALVDGTMRCGVRILDTSNNPQGVKFTTENKPRISSNDHEIDVARGVITGATFVRIEGINTDIDNVREDIITIGGTYIFPSAPGQMRLVSSSADDSSTGIGIRTIKIYYLDNNYNEGTETVTLNGTTPVYTIATNILRINKLEAASVGSTGAAVGTISLTDYNGTTTYMTISPLETVSRYAIFTVPANKTLYIKKWSCSGYTTGVWMDFAIRSMTSSNGNLGTVGLMYLNDNIRFGATSCGMEIKYAVPLKILGTSDVKITGLSSGSSSNAILISSLEGWLE